MIHVFHTTIIRPLYSLHSMGSPTSSNFGTGHLLIYSCPTFGRHMDVTRWMDEQQTYYTEVPDCRQAL